MKLIAHGGTVAGTIEVPGDKSISQRAALLGALANGCTHIGNFLDAGDCDSLLDALGMLGIASERLDDGRLRIHGRGNARWPEPGAALDLGNSGTAIRLLAGVLAGRGMHVVLTGDDSLRRRPMARIIEPLRRMGAVIDGDDGRPPLRIEPARLHGIDWTQEVASAQVKSCVLLAGLHADGTTRVTEPVATRDHTERLLRYFGIPAAAPLQVTNCDWDRVAGRDLSVPGDPSAAAFFAVAAAIQPGSDIRIPGICANPRRTGFVRILSRMGVDIDLSGSGTTGAEPVADLRVRGGQLRGVDIDDRQEIVDAIDELPVLMVAAACAEGRTTLTGAGELRHKESDRIATMAACLAILGADVRVEGDDMVIAGGDLHGGTIDSDGDHRIAMAAVVAGVRSHGPVVVEDAGVVSTSFPGFVTTARQAGVALEEVA